MSRRRILNAGFAVGLIAAFGLATAHAVEFDVEEELQALWQKAPRNMITVPMLKEVPKLDGALDDAVWQKASTVSDFIVRRYNLMRGQEQLTACYTLAQAQTQVWLYRTADALFIAVRADEPEIEALHLDYAGRDGRLWANDCVELFIEPTPGTTYQFILDANASIFDQKITGGKGDRKWNMADVEKNLAARVHKNEQDLAKSYWAVEIRIPFDQIGGAPEGGEKWGANFGRERYAAAYKNYGELSTWSGTFGGFDDASMFGRLVFSDVAVRMPTLATKTDLDHPFLGRNTARVELVNHKGKDTNVQATVYVQDRADVSGSKPQLLALAAGKAQQVELEYVVDTERVGYAFLALEDFGEHKAAPAYDAGILCQRQPFKSRDIGAALGKGIANAKALQERADPESEFAKSIAPYVTQLEALFAGYEKQKAEALKQTANAELVKAWDKLHGEAKGALRTGSYVVWTCSPYLPVGATTYPPELKDARGITVNACRNEYENAVINVTNLTGEHMDFYLQGNIPHAACNPRSGFPVPALSVVQNHGRDLGWTASTKSMSTEDDGLAMPLLELGKDAQLHVRPYTTRQVWLTAYTKDAEPTVTAGKKGKPYRSGVRIIPLSRDLATRAIGITLNVYDFEIPDVAEIGSYSFNYSMPFEFLTRYKINTFMLGAWPRPTRKKDGTIEVDLEGEIEYRVKPALPTQGKYKFVLSYGYTGSFMPWAEKQGLAYMSDEWKAAFKEVYRQMIAQYMAAGLTYDEFVVQTIDEAHGHMVKQVVETTPLLREVDPKVKLAMTVMCNRKEMEQMAPHVDCWFNRNGAKWDLEFLHQEQEKGKLLYSWHMSGDMLSPVISWTRTYGWRAEQHNFENISYFVFSNSAYRWQGEPIASRMLEAWRDTIEDWQYFNALHKAMAAARKAGAPEERIKKSEALIADALKNVLEREGGSQPYFPPDTQETADAVETERARIAQEIVELRALAK